MSLFFGRNVMEELKEATLMGRIEINNRPMRIKVNVVRDELHQLDNLIYKYVTDIEQRNQVRDQFKKVERLLSEL